MGSIANRSSGASTDQGVVAVPWYTEAGYAATLAIMEDSGLFPDSYSAWHRGAQDLVRQLRSAGISPVIVSIDPDDFLDWCQAEDVRADAESRLEYVRSVAAQLKDGPDLVAMPRPDYPGSPVADSPAQGRD